MTYEGFVRNGVVVFNAEAPPEGTPVSVVPLDAVADSASEAEPKAATSEDVKRMWDGLMKLAGRAKGLPSDLARRHDHYRRERQKR